MNTMDVKEDGKGLDRREFVKLAASGPLVAAGTLSAVNLTNPKVAEAAVEGSFFGFGGVRVSEAEKATLRDISKALGMAP